MADMTEFERRLATEVAEMAGPEPRVDAMEVVRRATTSAPDQRTRTSLSPATAIGAGALALALGGLLLVVAPLDRRGADVPGAASENEGAAVSPQPAPRDSVQWGTKRVYYAPPPGWPPSPSSLEARGIGDVVEFGVHEVARIAPTACPRTPALVEVGPSAEDLTDALANQTGLERSGPVDVMVDGHPAKRFVIYHAYPPGCPGEPQGYRSGPEGHVRIWENRDGTGLGMLDAGFAIILVADVEGERLVFAGCACGHGFYGPPDEMDLEKLEADADALIASIEIVDPDPMLPAWVTGSVSGGTPASAPVVTEMDGMTRSRYHWEDMRITMSDPRLSGTLDVTYNQDVHTGAAGDLPTFTVGAGTYRIENEAGTWEGPNIFLNRGSSGTATVNDTGVLVGSGAYEGLSAFLVFDFNQGSVPVIGAIFPGEMPPVATFE